jgi:hypothetical protein
MSKDITLKVGSIVTNRHGHFGKVIELKNGFVHFAGWFPKKKTAQEAEKATAFLNMFGMSRAMGESGVSSSEGNDGDDDVDPFKGVTVDNMKDALKEAGQPVDGKRPELIQRCQENNIEFKVEESE